MLLKSLKNFSLIAYFLSTWVMVMMPMDSPDKPKYTHIRDAVLADDQDAIVDFMMVDGGDINKKDDETGKTLFELALEEKKRNVANYMFFHGGIVEPENITDFIRYAFYPEIHGQDDAVELALMVLRESNLSQLIELAKEYSLDWTLELAAAQARVNVVEALLSTELPQKVLDKIAASLDKILKHSTHTDVQRARYRNIRYLLSGKNIHTAIEIGDDDFVDQYIRDGGDDVNAPDKEGTAPLQLAIRTAQNDIASKLALNGARYPWENITLLGEIFCHQSCIRGELAQAILDDDADNVIIHIKGCQDLCTSFALRLSIAQGRVACVTRLLTLNELSPKSLGDYLELVHRILHSTPHNPGQRARYETIRDLLMIHGSKSQQLHTQQARLLTIDGRMEQLLGLINRLEKLTEPLQNPVQNTPIVRKNPRDPFHKGS
jgi:Trp operon repressor